MSEPEPPKQPMRKFANIDAPEGDESAHETLEPGKRAKEALEDGIVPKDDE